MANTITKNSTAAEVISLCAIRKVRLMADHKGGFHEAPRGSRYFKYSKVRNETQTPPPAA